MTTCIQFTLHVCAEAVSVCECVCVCVICVPGIISVNLCVCEAVDSRQASLLSFSSLPQREAKRGDAAPFNRGTEERRRQKAEIKQMLESGLESQL